VEVKRPFLGKEVVYETRSEGGIAYQVVKEIRELPKAT
jgi:hypothetical protein